MGGAERVHIEQRLAEAEIHVGVAERLVERQRTVTDNLRRDCHDAVSALRLLAQMRESLRLHIDDRDRLRRELEQNRRTQS